MSFDLETTILGYAVEAGDLSETGLINTDIADDPSMIGATEITVITDNTQSTLEEALADTADKVEKLNNADASADALLKATDSLEALSLRLDTMSAEGQKLDGPAVDFLMLSIESSMTALRIPRQLWADQLNGLGTSFESNALADYTTEADEVINAPDSESTAAPKAGILTRVYNVLKTTAQSIATKFTDLVNTLKKNGEGIRLSGEKLKKAGGGISGEAKEGKIKSPGSVGADPAKTVADLASAEKEVVALSQKIKGALAPVLTALGNPSAAAVNTAEKFNVDETTIELGNGATLKFTPGEGEGLAKVSGAKIVVSGKGEGAEIDPLSPSEISALGTSLVSLGQAMTALSSEASQLAKDCQQIITAGQKAVKKDGTASKEDIKAANTALKIAAAAVKTAKGLIPAYVSHVGGVASAAYGVGIKSAARYGKGAAAAADTAAGTAAA